MNNPIPKIGEMIPDIELLNYIVNNNKLSWPELTIHDLHRFTKKELIEVYFDFICEQSASIKEKYRDIDHFIEVEVIDLETQYHLLCNYISKRELQLVGWFIKPTGRIRI